MLQVTAALMLTRSLRDSETSIDFVQGPPGSRRERVKVIVKSYKGDENDVHDVQ